MNTTENSTKTTISSVFTTNCKVSLVNSKEEVKYLCSVKKQNLKLTPL